MTNLPWLGVTLLSNAYFANDIGGGFYSHGLYCNSTAIIVSPYKIQ
jgi:hypothetical protein